MSVQSSLLGTSLHTASLSRSANRCAQQPTHCFKASDSGIQSQQTVANDQLPAESSRAGRRASSRLVQTLQKQVQKETVPWFQGMLQPWLDGVPPPLTDTVPPEQLADFDSKFVTVDGVRLHYKEAGTGGPGKPTVLLMHGLNGSTFSWRDVLQPLSEQGGSEGCRVIAFDRPPYGLSERPLTWPAGPEGNPYTSEAGARYAEGLLKALGIPQAIVVGHSAGALTAMELFKRNPSIISGFVFVAPALPSTSTKRVQRNQDEQKRKQDSKDGFIWRASLGQQLQRLYMRALLQNENAGLNYIRKNLQKRRDEVALGKLQVYADAEQEVKQAVIEGYLRPMLADDWDRGSLYSYRAFSFPSDMPYEEIRQPVMFITGEKDGALTQGAKKVADILKAEGQCSTEYVEYERCGHVPMDERPAEFLHDLQRFVTDVSSERQPTPDADSLTASVDDAPLPLYPPSKSAPVDG
ncbi:hypothetical protein WJX77_007900 [Trebouxia sp. C0004]